jgi:hypothetical protein
MKNNDFVRNELLFSNVFLNNIDPTADQLGTVYDFMHGARAWFQGADLSSETAAVQSFIRPFLQNQSLDLLPVVSEPSAFVLVAPWNPTNAEGLLFAVSPDQSLDGALPDGAIPKGQHWMIKAVDCARDLNICWVVLTNGRQWRLLDAQGLRRYEAYLEIDLEALVQDPSPGKDYDLAAYLFHSLFSLEKGLWHDPETGLCGLDQFTIDSLEYTQRTEQYLKYTVCDNLDVPGGGDGIIAQLCLGLVRAIHPDGVYSFTETERDAIYSDATYLLYRLLFIFYTEARGLLPAGEPGYDEISLRHLIDEALELHGNPEQAARRPTSLWDALLFLFNRIDVGDIALHVPAFNGGLFDNSQRPYLSKHAIENAYMADALVQLAFYRNTDQPDQLERIDYRDLSVRHLGSLYEGMIEYRLFIAEEDLLARREKDSSVRYLPETKTARKPNDELIHAGQVYFAQSPHERKATGTHYTLEDLVERLVRRTVLRLLDERWQEFEREFSVLLGDLEAASPERQPAMQEFIDQRLMSFVEEQVLSLRVCDPAMGSGHFLVHASHQITNFLLHTLTRTPWNNSSVNLKPADWRRRVVEQCVYGVDINPMAVELAKLSLWLVSMQADRPLSFLDHHLKHGNSLLGSTLEEIESLLTENEFVPSSSKTAIAEARGQYTFRELMPVLDILSKANSLMGKIAAQIVLRVDDVHQQQIDYADVEAILAPYKRIGDLLVARKMGWKVKDTEIRQLAKTFEITEPHQVDEQKKKLWEQACLFTMSQRTFHWELEFLQVFAGKGKDRHNGSENGFDIVIGNPPYLGGYKIRSQLGAKVAEYLRQAFENTGGQVDLCAYVLRQSYATLANSGFMGMVATNTIGQGDTRVAGLGFILRNGGTITYADRYVKWLGDATVEVNLLCVKKNHEGVSLGDVLLDGQLVPTISSWLDDSPEFEPFQLAQNKNQAFIGDALRGQGFVLDPQEALPLLEQGDNSLCLLPYLGGEDINSDPEQKPRRYVICFQNWPLEKAQQYPELLQILRDRVKPVRDKVKEKREKENWWLFARYRGELRRAIEPLNKVMARAVVSDTHAIVFLPKSMIFNHKIAVFAFEDGFHFSILQSSIHELWMRRYVSTMRTDTNYSVSDCFITFPFPQGDNSGIWNEVEQKGNRYHDFRHQMMLERQVGLTPIYNLFHNEFCMDNDVVNFRQLQADMDRSVLTAYGWDDIKPKHDFYLNARKKTRFVPSIDAQREIFVRLMELNQKIAAEEAAQGLAPDVNQEEEEPAE